MGQICTATSRIFVQDTIYDKFIERFNTEVKNSTVIGDPFDEKTTHGPQVSKVQYEKILGFFESAKSEGAKLAAGGEKHGDKGFYIQPTVFQDVKPSMKIAREEVFGPCVVIAPFSSEEEAISLANDTTYGLGAAVFTENLRKAHRVAGEIDAGTVWVSPTHPYIPAHMTYTMNRSTALRTRITAFHSVDSNSQELVASWVPMLFQHTLKSRLCMVSTFQVKLSSIY